MEPPSLPQLEALKYNELRRLAKAAGLKGTLKTEKLLNMLKQHFYGPLQENGSMVSKRSSSADTEELDNESVNLSMARKRHRRQEGYDAQGNQTGESIIEKENSFLPIAEILRESDESLSGAAPKMREIVNGMPEKLPSNSVVQSQGRERKSKQKETESRTPDVPFSGRKLHCTGSLPKSEKRRVISTPNFKKLHETEFKKMQSIVDYMNKKKKRMNNLSNSANESKACSKSQPSQSAKKSPSATDTPVLLRRSPRNSLDAANKSILSRKSPFSKTSLSATKLNVRFSESTNDNEHKRSLTKTPSRKSPFLHVCTPTSQKVNGSVVRKNSKGSRLLCQPQKTPNSAVTPFKFIAQSAGSLSKKKPVFDLQASLSKTLNYHPHKGKLQPWGKPKDNLQNMCSHKKAYKQPHLQTRDGRRERHVQERKQRKDRVLGTRRGLAL